MIYDLLLLSTLVIQLVCVPVLSAKSLGWGKMSLKGTTQPDVRYSHASTVIETNEDVFVVVVGGYNNQLEATWFSDTWFYSLNQMLWMHYETPKTIPTRYGHSLVLLGSSLVLFGGDDGGVIQSDSAASHTHIGKQQRVRHIYLCLLCMNTVHSIYVAHI